MSTVLFESVTTQLAPVPAPLSCQPHPHSQSHSRSLNLNIVVPGQINHLDNRFKHLSLSNSSSSSHKCLSHFMQASGSSSLQTPPPTPRRPTATVTDGFPQDSSHPPVLPPVQTRNYPRHLSFLTPRRLATSSGDSQGNNYTRIEDKLTEYSSDFAGVPVDYVRSLIRKRGKKLYDIARSSVQVGQRSGPQIMAKQSDHNSEMLPPSHILVVYPLNPSPTSAYVPEFYPIHSLIPTLYCANFPPFPKSENDNSSYSSSISLPQLPIRLPHPPSFKLLFHFLYTRNIQNIVSYLLPVPWSSRRHHDYISHPTLPVPISLSALTSLVHATAASLTSEDRWMNLDLLHGVYLNVVALGMYDLPLHGTRDEDHDQDSNSHIASGRKNGVGVERLNNAEWGPTIIQNGTRDVDGRLLCLCLIAMWEGLCKT